MSQVTGSTFAHYEQVINQTHRLTNTHTNTHTTAHYLESYTPALIHTDTYSLIDTNTYSCTHATLLDKQPENDKIITTFKLTFSSG